ncbi:MAG: LD-carboxypeptidase [Bacteroidales bacterium]|nr:LD-carboxypeptidase [Bacteroidales bacterium]
MTKIPPKLKAGDVVSLVTTARFVSRKDVAAAIAMLQGWGLRVLEPAHLYDVREERRCAISQFGNDDPARAAMLQEALDNPAVKAIFCCRGGYGTVRMVDLVDWSSFVRQPKWIVGYSDVTVLHSHIARQFGIATMHAIMPINVPPDTVAGTRHPAIETCRKALFEESLSYALDADCLRAGAAEGVIVGGNLSVLYSLMGSVSEVETDGKILFIEDVDEYLYHIDRMMQCLRRAGKLKRLAGLLVGQFTDMHDNGVPFGMDVRDIVADAVKGYAYPVVLGCPFGHIGVDNMALPLGANVNMRAVEEGRTALTLAWR